jgi:hypothetical protein
MMAIDSYCSCCDDEGESHCAGDVVMLDMRGTSKLTEIVMI